MKYFDQVLQNWRITVARRWISTGATILDIGCHSGELFECLDNCLGYGIGVDPLAPARVNSRYRLIPGVFGQDTLFETAAFDTITMLATIEHILEKDSIAAECYRLLRHGGYLVITVPVPAVTKIVKFLRQVRLLDGMAIHEHHDFSPSETIPLFTRIGFRLVKHAKFQLGLNHLFVFDKPMTDKTTPSPPTRVLRC